MSARFRIILSSSFALLGIVSCLAYADSVRTEAEKVRSDALERFGGEVARIVVANQQLEAGDLITESNVSMRDWLADLAPAEAITSFEDVLGRELSEPVAEGVPLTGLNFRDETALAEVPDGHVAVSVPVSEKLGISRGVTRGVHVSAYEVRDESPRLIATNIEVLSELNGLAGAYATQQLTIAVLPQHVADVLGASAAGSLRLVIPADDVRDVAEGLKEDQGNEAEAPNELAPKAEEGEEQ